MRTIQRFGLGVAALGAATAVMVAPANAAPYSTGSVGSSAANTVTYKITNLTDSVRGCEAFLSGRVNYTSPRVRISPRSTSILTVKGVPAGNYSAWWACDSFAHGKTVVTVGGKTSGRPYLAPTAPSTPNTGLEGLLSLFGS